MQCLPNIFMFQILVYVRQFEVDIASGLLSLAGCVAATHFEAVGISALVLQCTVECDSKLDFFFKSVPALFALYCLRASVVWSKLCNIWRTI